MMNDIIAASREWANSYYHPDEIDDSIDAKDHFVRKYLSKYTSSIYHMFRRFYNARSNKYGNLISEFCAKIIETLTNQANQYAKNNLAPDISHIQVLQSYILGEWLALLKTHRVDKLEINRVTNLYENELLYEKQMAIVPHSTY
eukprot:TRINITY_DN7790_c0_g1_i1.p1 TRINITY_DN7790_c0_g1~~TRINITY_DN7790_c0_g1_i1.p1  ORF type:complete len:144 (+),score=2.13 TRINITY_DN7790_c0_g1_i1:129-560(+)